MTADHQDLTVLLNRVLQGDADAERRIMPLVYAELRRIARARAARLPSGETLQPTALVHEAWLQITERHEEGWEGRRHFYFVAARAMRDILIDHARERGAEKRGGGRQRVDLSEEALRIESPVDDMIAFDDALSKLEVLDPDAHRVVMLRCFTGMTMDEVASLLGIPKRTLERRWRFARAWLREESGFEG